MGLSFVANRNFLIYGFIATFFALWFLALPFKQVRAAVTQLLNDNGTTNGYSSSIRQCWVYGSVLQATANQHPLRVLSVDFVLYRNFQNAANSAQVRAVVYSIGADNRPAALLARSDVMTITTFYPSWVSIPLTNTQIYLSDPGAFLVGVEFVNGIAGTVPSLLTDSNTNVPVARNFYSQTCGGSWFEHYQWWNSPAGVGYNMIRATIEPNTQVLPTWTPTHTPTATPGPSPTLIPGQVTPGFLAGAGKQHALARSADGRLHLIYSNSTDQQLYHIWSDNNGTSWQPASPLLIANSPLVEAVLALGTDNTLHTIYGPWDGQQVSYKRYNGSIWGTATPIGDGAYGRNMVIDRQGHIHVVWSNNDTWYTYFDGTGWSSPRQIAFGAWHPTIAIGPDDSLHVAYNDNDYCCNHDGVEVRYIFSLDGGNNWSLPENVSQDGIWSGGASMAVTPNGNVHLTYIAQSPIAEGSLYYRERQSGQWSSAEIISNGNAGVTTGTTGGESAAMTVDTEGTLFVVFRCRNGAGRADICLRIRDWQGWLSVMDFTNNIGVDSKNPAVIYGTIPEGQGLDSAWNTNGQVIYHYLPRNQWSVRPTYTPTPTSTPTPGVYYARVIDESGQPVNGARVYKNGVAPSDLNGQPVLTSNGGVLNFSSLQSGDTLVALALQEQRPTPREAHNGDSDPRYAGQNWAYRVYLTNININNQGLMNAYQVSAPSSGEHRLVVDKNHPLVLFQLVISIEWDATADYINEIVRAIRHASDYLFDLTDGQMAFGQVAIYDGGDHWSEADIQISTKNIVHPHAYIGGIISADKSQVIRIGRGWDGDSGNQGPWDQPEGFRTLTHEFGHYALHLYDEYFAYIFDQNGNLTGQVPAYCTMPHGFMDAGKDQLNASAMYYQYKTSELSARNVPGMWSALCEQTAQWQLTQRELGQGESAWDTLIRKYADPQTPSRWQFITPMKRGNVLGGPVNLPPNLLPFPQITIHNSGSSEPPRQLTVRSPEGQGYQGAIVALYKKGGGSVIGQGFTDNNGQLTIFGAEAGDDLRAASFDAALAGKITIGSGASLTLNLSPVSGLTTQANSQAPHMRVIAEPGRNPDQIDLLISLLNFGPGANPEVIITEPGSGTSYSPSAWNYTPTTNTYNGQVSFSASEQGMWRIRAGGTIGNTFVRLQSTYRLQRVVNTQSQDIYSDDGNLSLHLEIGSLAGSEAYFVVMPPGAAPGPLPSGLVLIGDIYDITASGALVSLEKPGVLALHYDGVLINSSSVPVGLGIYRWNPSSQKWQAVPGSSDEEHRVAVASVTVLGTYALLAPAGSKQGIFLPVIIKNVLGSTKCCDDYVNHISQIRWANSLGDNPGMGKP